MEVITFDKEIYKVIKMNIRKYRKQKGLTSAELAEMIDVSHEYMRQVQSEKDKHNCSLQTLYKICIALDIKMDDLFSTEMVDGVIV